ncbi:MAG: sigma-70 family RNA polymerase sigma factor [Acidimicrobiia bacterium]|nr:sigma-70 family RNA polymerase sigma factor [Acidimicrobiia bacterium]
MAFLMSGDEPVPVPVRLERLEDFDAFYAANLRPVVALVFSLTGSRAAAEDVAQDAFAAAFRRWATVGTYDEPGAWVRRVAVNRAVSRHRKLASEGRALLRLAGRREDPAALEPADDEFWRSVRALPTRQAQVVALHYLEDRSVEDIAHLLGVAEPTVRVHLHRGRHELARKLGLDGEVGR